MDLIDETEKLKSASIGKSSTLDRTWEEVVFAGKGQEESK